MLGLEALGDGLTEQATAAEARLSAAVHAFTAWLEAFGTAQQTAAGELAALEHAATVFAEQRLAAARSAVDEAGESLGSGAGRSRDALEGASADARETLTAVEDGAQGLEEQAADVLRENDAALAEIQARVAAAGAGAAQAGAEASAALDQTTGYLGQALEGFLRQAFETYRAHLDGEAQPYLGQVFDDLAAGVLRCFEDFQSAVEAVGVEVMGATSTLMSAATDFTNDLARQHQRQADRTEEEALAAIAEEASRSIAAMAEGHQVASALAAIAPPLGASREVVHQVEEMMNAFNPFD